MAAVCIVVLVGFLCLTLGGVKPELLDLDSEVYQCESESCCESPNCQSNL